MVFGLSSHVPSRAGLADEAFERFVAMTETNAVHSRELKTVFVSFLLDSQSRMLVEPRQHAGLRARDPDLYGSLQRLDPQERNTLIQHLQSPVSLKQFEAVAS